jgi:hypothetical protein
MSMPIPPPAVTLPQVWASRSSDGRMDGQHACDIEGGGGVAGQVPSYPPSRPPVSASTFSVTMPCALAWKEKTG